MYLGVTSDEQTNKTGVECINMSLRKLAGTRGA